MIVTYVEDCAVKGVWTVGQAQMRAGMYGGDVRPTRKSGVNLMVVFREEIGVA